MGKYLKPIIIGMFLFGLVAFAAPIKAVTTMTVEQLQAQIVALL